MDRFSEQPDRDKAGTSTGSTTKAKRKLSTRHDNQVDITLPNTREATSSSMSFSKRFKFPGITSTKPTGTASKTSLIVRFYDSAVHAKDAHGRTMEEILDWPDSQLERCHNYIQMLFPVPEGSMFNWEAPIIDREVMEAFHARSDLQDRLRLSFERMLHFYGFVIAAKQDKEKPKSEQKPKEEVEAEDGDQAEAAKEQQKGKDEIAETTTTTPSETVGTSDMGPAQGADLNYAYHIVRGPNWTTNSRNWAVRFDHNHLRITRILRCLRVLGLQKECDAFFAALEEVFNGPAIRINERSMTYWRRAVTRPLYIAPDDDEVDWLKDWEQQQQKVEEKGETKDEA